MEQILKHNMDLTKNSRIVFLVSLLCFVSALLTYDYHASFSSLLPGDMERRRLETHQTIYTYVDESEQHLFDKELIKLWSDSWEGAGWDVKVLTPKDAKQHPEYDHYINLFDKAEICCLLRQSYIGHLAMTAVKTGGFFSEVFVFPLNTLESTPLFMSGQLPNDGKFTSYDGVTGSLLSGSHEEWNRVINILKESIEGNSPDEHDVNFNLRRLTAKDEPENFTSMNVVIGTTPILSQDQFRTNICEDVKSKVAIRFDVSELAFHGFDQSERPNMVRSWMRIHKARCHVNRPLVFTFFQYLDTPDGRLAQDVLFLWEDVWRKAGWEPVVLTHDDAKRHPNYRRYNSILTNSKHFEGGRDRYGYFCYIRWLAVAASGGGFMSDFDTFPLHLQPTFQLPNDGKFTGYQRACPNLVSGSMPEWNRVIGLIFRSFERNKDKDHWSDMFAAQEIYFNVQAFLSEDTTIQIFEFYDEEVERVEKKEISSFNAVDLVKDKCGISDSKKAIHFSHMGCDIVGFCHKEKRASGAKIWLDEWLQNCSNETAVKHIDSI